MFDGAGVGEAKPIGFFDDRQAVREIARRVLVAWAHRREELHAELHDRSVGWSQMNIVPIGIILSMYDLAVQLDLAAVNSRCCRTRRAGCRAVRAHRDQTPRTDARFLRRGERSSCPAAM